MKFRVSQKEDVIPQLLACVSAPGNPDFNSDLPTL